MKYLSEEKKKEIMGMLTDKRRIHTEGVRLTAQKLAEIYGADKEKTDVACVLHDLYRGKKIEELNQLVDELRLDKKYINNANLSHGKIAAVIARRDFGITDREIIDAISYHTTGRPNMSLVEKIVFIADAIEPGRNYPGVEEMRKIAEKDLDKACFMSLDGTIKFLQSNAGMKLEDIDEDTVNARDTLMERSRQ